MPSESPCSWWRRLSDAALFWERWYTKSEMDSVATASNNTTITIVTAGDPAAGEEAGMEGMAAGGWGGCGGMGGRAGRVGNAGGLGGGLRLGGGGGDRKSVV